MEIVDATVSVFCKVVALDAYRVPVTIILNVASSLERLGVSTLDDESLSPLASPKLRLVTLIVVNVAVSLVMVGM